MLGGDGVAALCHGLALLTLVPHAVDHDGCNDGKDAAEADGEKGKATFSSIEVVHAFKNDGKGGEKGEEDGKIERHVQTVPRHNRFGAQHSHRRGECDSEEDFDHGFGRRTFG